jgi:hypothetical protein
MNNRRLHEIVTIVKRFADVTVSRLMVKGVKNGTEITFELFCVEVVQENYWVERIRTNHGQ